LKWALDSWTLTVENGGLVNRSLILMNEESEPDTWHGNILYELTY